MTFQEAYELYKDKIQTMLFMKCGSYEDAEDLSQNVWIKVYENIDKFRGESRLYTWIYTIAKHELYNHTGKYARTYRKQQEVEDQSDDLESLQETETIEAEFAAIELREEIERRIIALNQDFKDTLVLREFGGFSYEQISEITNVPVNTVRSRLHRARESILEREG